MNNQQRFDSLYTSSSELMKSLLLHKSLIHPDSDDLSGTTTTTTSTSVLLVFPVDLDHLFVLLCSSNRGFQCSDSGLNDCSSTPSRSELLNEGASAIPTLFRPLKAADLQSRDSLHSLVQYCITANQGLRSQHEANVVPGEGTASLHSKPLPDSSTDLNHYNLLSFDRSLSVSTTTCLHCFWFDWVMLSFTHANMFPTQQGRSKLRQQPQKGNKARVCWTADLHKRFVRSVDHLGGARSKCRNSNNFQE